MQPWFTVYIFGIAIGHPRYGQSTLSKHFVFFKLTAAQVPVFNWIAGSSQVTYCNLELRF